MFENSPIHFKMKCISASTRFLHTQKLFPIPHINVYKSFSSTRKLISPAIMKIHPDRYQNDSKEIQSNNLKCLQTLNELLDRIEDLEDQINVKTVNSIDNGSIVIGNPWSSNYTLNCYFRKNIDQEEISKSLDVESVNNLETITVSVSIMPILCTRGQTIKPSTAKLVIHNILTQVGIFCTMLDVENPFKNISKPLNRQKTVDAKIENQMDFRQLHIELFERSLKYNKYRRIMPYEFDSSNRKMKESRSMKRVRDLLSLDVSIYLTNGNVKLRNISIYEERDLMIKFQDFLVEYGAYINFDLKIWANVYVILHNDDDLPRTRIGDNSSDSGYDSRFQGYSYMTHANKVIIEIPKKFKNNNLLSFLSEHSEFALGVFDAQLF